MKQNFEELMSNTQELSFDAIRNVLSGVLGERNSAMPEVRNGCGQYTNFALMISDQCPWRFCVETPDTTIMTEGPLPAQIEQVLDITERYNPSVKMGKRIGLFKRFPVSALRETLVNAVIHFDASGGDTIRVSVNDDILTVISPGGLFRSESESDTAPTVPRNPKMARMLTDLKMAHLKGKGLPLIRSCYNSSGMIPCIMTAGDTFRVNLPPIDNIAGSSDAGREKIYRYLCQHRGCLISELSSDLMMSVYQTKRILENMESDGEAFSMGLGSERRLFLTDPRGESIRIEQRSFPGNYDSSYFYGREITIIYLYDVISSCSDARSWMI